MAAMEQGESERIKAIDGVPLSPILLPWDRFSNWLHCACVVTFDLELGQAMEVHTRKIIIHLVHL